MWQSAHVEDLATLAKEGPDVSAGIHGTGEHVGVLVCRLGLADETTKDPSKRHCFFHSAAWRSRGKSLQVEGQVVLDGRRRLDWLDFKSGTDVSQGTRPKGKGLWVVGLPSLIFGTEIKCS